MFSVLGSTRVFEHGRKHLSTCQKDLLFVIHELQNVRQEFLACALTPQGDGHRSEVFNTVDALLLVVALQLIYHDGDWV